MNGDDLAFPFACQGPTTGPEIYYGLTKREFLAAMALQGWLAGCTDGTPPPELSASRCVEYADALIAELNKVPNP